MRFFDPWGALASCSHFNLLLFGEDVGKPGHLGD